MCYITNTQNTEEQNQQRNFARFFAPNQNYQYPFAFQLNAKPINDYQDESSEGYDSQEQYQYGYPMQQQQNYVYLDNKPYNQNGINNQNVYNNENEIFNILGPINENNEVQNVQESAEYYSDAIYNQVYNDNEAPLIFAKNEEEVFYQPQYQDNNTYNNFEAPVYNNNIVAPQNNEQLQANYASQPEFNQYYPQQQQQQPQFVPQGYEVNGYQEQIPQQYQLPQYPQMSEAPIIPQSNLQNQYLAQVQQKQEYCNDVQSSSNIGEDETIKYDDQGDEDFEKDGSEEQNEIIDKIKKSNKKNVVKNIMSAFKRFIQDIQSETSQSSSPSNIDSSSNLSFSTASLQAAKPSKISNLKQNISNSDSYQINVAVERDNVLAIYNNSKVKPDSIEEMGKKFKRYISSKQFNHYTIRLLVQHQNYGQIFKYFLENHANSWLNNSKVDDPYGHKIMIEFLMASYEDINIIEKLKKHEKRKAIYQ
ncbi:hypothetical protein ABPG72_001330 [Tetrahymena utriculariae]